MKMPKSTTYFIYNTLTPIILISIILFLLFLHGRQLENKPDVFAPYTAFWMVLILILIYGIYDIIKTKKPLEASRFRLFPKLFQCYYFNVIWAFIPIVSPTHYQITHLLVMSMPFKITT